MEKDACKLVSSAVLGMDIETVVVNGKRYVITPPTIHKIAGMGYCLSKYGSTEMNSVMDMLSDVKDAAKALSYIIQGDESLYDEFTQAPLSEVVQALQVGVSLISVENFIVLSGLARNVAALIAKPRP